MPQIPFTKEEIEELSKIYPTPFHIYDEERIRKTAKEFREVFGWAKGFQNFFAVKALPNPYILSILKEEGMGVDCSSFPELILAKATGIKGENIMFSANDTPPEEFIEARQLGAIINLDDISHIDALRKSAGMPEMICFRYNPGKEKTGNSIIGEPVEAKYGLRKDQLFKAYEIAKRLGVKRFGLHTMVCSNEREVEYLIDTARMLFELAEELRKEKGIELEFINLGGGVGIPYSPEDKTVDLRKFSEGVKKAYENSFGAGGTNRPRIVMECGRAVTGPHGWLVSRVRHVTEKHKDYVGLDACMADLMRPALYGAHHEITILGKENQPATHIYDVTGSLCENNDKFAIDRKLPEVSPGDLLVIHNTGAHGHAMGFNYNGKLRSAEFLRMPDGKFRMIRRAESSKDYFATLDFEGSKYVGLIKDGE